MTFPSSPRIEFAHNPLDEVVCQLNFPDILAIGAGDPVAFQDRIRGQYPLYQRQGAIQLAGFEPVIQQMPVGMPNFGVAHRFQSEGGRSVVLANNSIVIAENAYARWGDFRAAVEMVVKALEDVYSPAFYSRVGLRYRNVVDRQKLGIADRAWSELLEPALTGMLSDDHVHPHVESIGANSLIRLDDGTGALIRLQYGLAQSAETREQVFVVDTDTYTEARHEREDIYETLAAFNTEIGNLFRWAIRQPLRDALGERDDH